MYKLIKPILFAFEPEIAHDLAMQWLEGSLKIPVFSKLFQENGNGRAVQLGKLKFKNPVGLAAGFDKNAQYVHALSQLGFSHIEVGTVTPKPQPGNPKPRLFRLPQDQALINRMGFNNVGAELVAKRLENRPNNVIIGGNIGKNKETSNQDALLDYIKCFEMLFDVVDYFTVNISSPNTPNLRALQDKEPLIKLLSGLQEQNQKKAHAKPLFLKIAPDLATSQMDEVVQICLDNNFDAIIATNTTINRGNLLTSKNKIENIGQGGLSGLPLTSIAQDFTLKLLQAANGKIPIIASGGIMTLADAQNRIQIGCSLVQVYTGFVYNGYQFVKELTRKL